MSTRLLLALLATLIAVPAASAASFDCAKASSPMEKAICADPALSAKDDVLGVAWQTAIGGLKESAGGVMRKGQKDWLAYLGKICADDALPGQAPVAEERAQCIGGEYDSRIRELEASRMLGGLRFYIDNSYWTAPDPDGGDYAKVARVTSSAVKLDEPAKEAKGFNATIAAAVATNTDQMAADGEEAAKASADSDLSLAVDHVNDARIDVRVSTYWFGHGAAHGNYSITYLHYLREQGRALEASDIFAGEQWQSHLAALVLARLKADRGELLWDIEQSWLEETVADPTRWDFADGGLVIQFQPYEVASYADGAVRAQIDWTQLEDSLSETGSALIYN